MPMTKKDFILIADAFIAAKKQTAHSGDHLRTASECEGIDLVIYTTADAIAREYPRFKRERWIGYIEGKCGPNGGQR